MNPISRSTRIMRAGAFLLLAFPLVVFAYQGFPVVTSHLSPITRASAIAVTLTYFTHVLLRSEGRSVSDYRVSFTWRSSKDLFVGFAGGFVLFGVGAVGLRVALPFEWFFNP